MWFLRLLGWEPEPTCPHKWEEVEQIKVYGGDRGANAIPTARIYVLRCVGCGDLKQHRVQG